MAITAIRRRSELATAFVLAPERYDPRRTVAGSDSSILLGSLVTLVRTTINPAKNEETCLVLDTSDAREGIVISRGVPKTGLEIGSTKKVIQPGDVIVSRLRPYLRQVAYVDNKIQHASGKPILCSTEFFPLRSPDDRSIAFLVPFLLSKSVQEALAAAQEGGHHPRFSDSTLLALPVPQALIDRRDAISRQIETSVDLYRQSERGIIEAIQQAEAPLETSQHKEE